MAHEEFWVFVRHKEIHRILAILQLYGHRIDHRRNLLAIKIIEAPRNIFCLISGASLYKTYAYISHGVKTSNCAPGVFVILMWGQFHGFVNLLQFKT